MRDERESRARSNRACLLFGAALAVAAIFAGCLIAPRKDGPRGPLSISFPHKTHIDADLECVDCHEAVEKSPVAGMPEKEVCLDCHEDGEEPFEKEIETLPTLDWKLFSDLQDVHFSHQKHTQKGYECTACHGEVAQSMEVTALFALRQETCRECHAKEGVDLSCETCHLEARKEKPPPSHTASWRRMHGTTYREGGVFHHGRDCESCHREDFCSECHREEAPRDHNEIWRVRTHGLAAEIERERCQTCHMEDTCVRCHLSGDVLPRSHRKSSWGRPRDKHCLHCHQSGDWSGCVVCHAGTPSHALAPPRPLTPPHPTATEANCRACHSISPSLHVDNGDPCTGCH